MFEPQDSVVISVPQLHGKSSVIEKGEVISVAGDTANVLIDGEDVPRTVPLDRLRAASDVFGEQTGQPNESAVIDAIRY